MNILEYLTCPICADIMTNSHITKCGHKFCGTCIIDCIDMRNRCPICNGTLKITDLVRDVHFNNLTDKVKLIQKQMKDDLIDDMLFAGCGDINVELNVVLKKHISKLTEKYSNYFDNLKRKLEFTDKLGDEKRSSIEKDIKQLKCDLAEHLDKFLNANLPNVENLPVIMQFYLVKCGITIKMSAESNQELTTDKLLNLIRNHDNDDYTYNLCRGAKFFCFKAITSYNLHDKLQMVYKFIEMNVGDGDDAEGIYVYNDDGGDDGGGGEGGNDHGTNAWSFVTFLSLNESVVVLVVGDVDLAPPKRRVGVGDERENSSSSSPPLLLLSSSSSSLTMKKKKMMKCFNDRFDDDGDGEDDDDDYGGGGGGSDVRLILTGDFFKCMTCSKKWICISCNNVCHSGHNAMPYILGYKSDRPCCLCEKTGCCKINKR